MLTDPDVAPAACVSDGERGVLEVQLTDPDGSTADLVYLFAREDGAWRIEAAQSADLPGGDDLGTPV